MLISDIIFNECISKTPFYIKNAAFIWREIFKCNQNNDKDKEKDDDIINDNIESSEKEDTSSDIDLLDID